MGEVGRHRSPRDGAIAWKYTRFLCEMVVMERCPTGCALAAPPPIDGKDIVAEIDVEKRPILLDAKRRPLQARVGPQRVHIDFDERNGVRYTSLHSMSASNFQE